MVVGSDVDVAATGAVGDGVEGSLLAEQAEVIRSTAMITRAARSSGRLARLSCNCCGTKLLRLPRIAIHSVPLRTGFIELLAMPGELDRILAQNERFQPTP